MVIHTLRLVKENESPIVPYYATMGEIKKAEDSVQGYAEESARQG
jgi:hypothetical protein